MGISATGARHIVRPTTVPVLFIGILLGFAIGIFAYGPPLVPGMKGAAEEKCNKLNGSNYRSFLLDWDMPNSPTWDPPHWDCYDRREPDKAPVSFGWWVNPL